MTDITLVERLRNPHGHSQIIMRLEAADTITRQAATIERLREALGGLLDHYVQLVNCGDCGFWNPETEPPVILARTALQETGDGQ